jgi:hypothetical protein
MSPRQTRFAFAGNVVAAPYGVAANHASQGRQVFPASAKATSAKPAGENGKSFEINGVTTGTGFA